MISLYCPDGSLMTRLGGLLRGHDLTAIREWPRFERAALAAECSVAVIERLSDGPTFPALCTLKRRLPEHPVLLITLWDPENARHLKAVMVEEVVWLHEVERAFPRAFTRIATGGLLPRISRELGEARHLSPRLRQALELACRSSRPFRSVTDLCAAVGCHRRTLSYHWRRAVGPDSTLRLEDFLDWVLLLDAVAMRIPGVKWGAVADGLGVHEHTLGRLARRLAGVTLRELHHAGRERLAEEFARTVVSPLLHSPPDPPGPL